MNSDRIVRTTASAIITPSATWRALKRLSSAIRITGTLWRNSRPTSPTRATTSCWKPICRALKRTTFIWDVSGDTLTIKAERLTKNKTEDKKDRYVCSERSYGSYSRSFDITGIDAAGIKAKYNNGVLSLTLPKKVEKQPESQRVEIE